MLYFSRKLYILLVVGKELKNSVWNKKDRGYLKTDIQGKKSTLKSLDPPSSLICIFDYKIPGNVTIHIT